MLLLNCALSLVEEIILYYDARSKKHQKDNVTLWRVRLTIVAVKITMLYVYIVFDVRVAVNSINVVYCCLGSTTVGSLCTDVGLQNISDCYR